MSGARLRAVHGPRLETRDEFAREIRRQLARWRVVLQCARTPADRASAESAIAAYQEVHTNLLGGPADVEARP